MAKEVFRIGGRYSVVELNMSRRPNGDFDVSQIKVKIGPEEYELQAANLSQFLYMQLYGLMNLQTNKYEAFYYNKRYAMKQAKKREKDYLAAIEKVFTSSE